MQEGSSHGVVELIVQIVSRHYMLSVSDIYGKDKHKRKVEARQMAAYLARESCKLSYPEIGAALGQRDHTTAMQSVKSFQQKLNVKKVSNIYEQVRAELKETLRNTTSNAAYGVFLPLTMQMRERLELLVSSGCFGASVEEAAERIIAMYIYENVGELCLVEREIGVEDDDDEA